MITLNTLNSLYLADDALTYYFPGIGEAIPIFTSLSRLFFYAPQQKYSASGVRATPVSAVFPRVPPN